MQHFKGPFSLEVGIDGKLQMPVLVTHGGAADVGTQLKENLSHWVRASLKVCGLYLCMFLLKNHLGEFEGILILTNILAVFIFLNEKNDNNNIYGNRNIPPCKPLYSLG